MNREIKFRAWDNVNACWCSESELWINGEGTVDYGDVPLGKDDDITIESCTGIKDWWEDDILRSDHYRDRHSKNVMYLYHRIVWSEKYGSWYAMNTQAKSDENEAGNCSLWVYVKNSHNIVKAGTVHENPELLI